MADAELTRRRMLVGAGAGIVGTVAALTTVNVGLAHDAERDPGLEGAWAIQVTQTQPVAAPPFRGLVTFAAGGAVVEVNQRNQPAGLGAWAKINEREFRYTFTRFRFDAAGGLIGWVTARETGMLDEERDSFEAEISLQIFDSHGQPIGSASGISHGKRIEP